jgi:hypothetical protein
MFWTRKRAEPFEPWPTPDWKNDGLEKSLEYVRVYAERQIHRELDWYRRHIGSTRLFSRWFRAVAIVFTSIGGLVPVLKSAGAFDLLVNRWPSLKGATFDLGELGYVFLAVAGSVAFFDRFFGFSTAWMRYVSAMTAIERVLELFRHEWVALSRPRVGVAPEEGAGRLLETAKRFVLKAKELSERETEAWIGEFRTNLAQFEKDLRAQVESARPGAIDVKIKDGVRAKDGVDVRLDQLLAEHTTGTTASVAQVTPGLHKVSATATVLGKTYSASQIVSVTAAEVTLVELELGIA